MSSFVLFVLFSRVVLTLSENITVEPEAYETPITENTLSTTMSSILDNFELLYELQNSTNTTETSEIYKNMIVSYQKALEQIEDEQNVQKTLKTRIETLEKSNTAKHVVDYESGEVTDDNSTLTIQDPSLSIKDDPAVLHEDIHFLMDIVLVLVGVTICGASAVSIKIPIFVGFIIAGIIIGPSGVGLINQLDHIETLAQVGAALILFGQGLEFNSDNFMKFKRLSLFGFIFVTAVNGAVLLLLITFFVDLTLTVSERILLILSLCLCSSTVAQKLANDYQLQQHSLFSHLQLALVVGQDFFMGIFLCFPDALALGFFGVLYLLKQVVFAMMIVYGAIYISVKIMPRMTRYLIGSDPQLFLLACVSICLSSALIARALGLSGEFGAFFAGISLTRTKFHHETMSTIEASKDLFGAIFFASVGMVISPMFILNNLSLILHIFSIVFTVKLISFFSLLRYFGTGSELSFIVSLSISQIAEFSMLLSCKGYTVGVVSRHNYLVFLTVAVISLIITPLLFKLALTVFPIQIIKTHKLVSVDVKTLGIGTSDGEEEKPVSGLRTRAKNSMAA